MERLTIKFPNGYLFQEPKTEEGALAYINAIAEKLGKLEDAEEQGLLLRLPCKVGDKVYLIDHNIVSVRKTPLQCVVDEFTVDKNECYAVLNGDVNIYMMRRFKAVNITNFGKTVFLTEEEAEQALKQMGEQKYDVT